MAEETTGTDEMVTDSNTGSDEMVTDTADVGNDTTDVSDMGENRAPTGDDNPT